MNTTKLRTLAYDSADDMMFGSAVSPVTCGLGVTIGGGQVLPEVNFTLPAISIEDDTISEVRDQYRRMVSGILERAVQLDTEAIVLEFEHLFELTQNPRWGAEITSDIKEVMTQERQAHGLRSALRVTVADIREQVRPPLMRRGPQLEQMLESFDACAKAGADILSIESTGGKELFDKAVIEGDVESVTFSMGMLACIDMAFLWPLITDIARRNNVVSGGDTDCAHSNTTMQLAHQMYLPKTLAAVVRAMGAVRSLVAYEGGAVGPAKDCGYENPVIKAITGAPISMEGKSSACAHSSPMGNIAASVCDLWSNESVQNVKLLGGYAPEVSAEMLIYDCRLMNQAIEGGNPRALRDLYVASDRNRDPQALLLDPEVCYRMAEIIVDEDDDYKRTLAAANFACETIEEATTCGELTLEPRERTWLSRIENELAELAGDHNGARERIFERYGEVYLPEEYGLD
ncbi:MAG: methyltransferase MtaB domain-containing protein [SAR202 cluster bacterium]|nr:methyltransferase MtaB domain-containing protein [SAR202 cluster bacterium]MDP6512897.1 methyltransferase MtaB domain-containing protein [SAR202 cluster bacterium]MDP6713121.1 methyltransferase MtaB domain-containing protein [SAR202 cluster bacterium]